MPPCSLPEVQALCNSLCILPDFKQQQQQQQHQHQQQPQLPHRHGKTSSASATATTEASRRRRASHLSSCVNPAVLEAGRVHSVDSRPASPRARENGSSRIPTADSNIRAQVLGQQIRAGPAATAVTSPSKQKKVESQGRRGDGGSAVGDKHVAEQSRARSGSPNPRSAQGVKEPLARSAAANAAAGGAPATGGVAAGSSSKRFDAGSHAKVDPAKGATPKGSVQGKSAAWGRPSVKSAVPRSVSPSVRAGRSPTVSTPTKAAVDVRASADGRMGRGAVLGGGPAASPRGSAAAPAAVAAAPATPLRTASARYARGVGGVAGEVQLQGSICNGGSGRFLAPVVAQGRPPGGGDAGGSEERGLPVQGVVVDSGTEVPDRLVEPGRRVVAFGTEPGASTAGAPAWAEEEMETDAEDIELRDFLEDVGEDVEDELLSIEMDPPPGGGYVVDPVARAGFSRVVGEEREVEEKVHVSVRVRPMNAREVAAGDQVAWRVQDSNTLQFVPSASEQRLPPQPTAHHFDNVFGPDCPSQRVYEAGARNVVMSALSGVHASIFAYGMTSSGKTYTMKAITEMAVNDIFGHIRQAPEREFLIKLSALEIYNEVVKDLMNPDSGPLRLLDDPDRGTMVDGLTEVVVKSQAHLQELLEVCAAHRQVGETSLNDDSSRSHQIVRLTVESSPVVLSSSPSSAPVTEQDAQVLSASLNFVDLAGSERASQTNAKGARLKEGAHINRSLLALGTVIRKLSGDKAEREGHIPYRNSKLTRILQHSLGGSGRTAIICTLSPALVHVEQTRNTLAFAARAKEVANTVRVNAVLSDTVLVQQLQREVARLEAELQVLRPNREQVEAQRRRLREAENLVEEVVKQRDEARAELEEVRAALAVAMEETESLKLQLQAAMEAAAEAAATASIRSARETKAGMEGGGSISDSSSSSSSCVKCLGVDSSKVTGDTMSSNTPDGSVSSKPKAKAGRDCRTSWSDHGGGERGGIGGGGVGGAGKGKDWWGSGDGAMFRKSLRRSNGSLRKGRKGGGGGGGGAGDSADHGGFGLIPPWERSFDRWLMGHGTSGVSGSREVGGRGDHHRRRPPRKSSAAVAEAKQQRWEQQRRTEELVREIKKLEQMQHELGEDAGRAMQALRKEIECLRLAQMGMSKEAAQGMSELQVEVKSMHEQSSKRSGNLGPPGAATAAAVVDGRRSGELSGMLAATAAAAAVCPGAVGAGGAAAAAGGSLIRVGSSGTESPRSCLDLDEEDRVGDPKIVSPRGKDVGGKVGTAGQGSESPFGEGMMSPLPAEEQQRDLRQQMSRLEALPTAVDAAGSTIASLEQQLESVQQSLDSMCLVGGMPGSPAMSFLGSSVSGLRESMVAAACCDSGEVDLGNVEQVGTSSTAAAEAAADSRSGVESSPSSRGQKGAGTMLARQTEAAGGLSHSLPSAATPAEGGAEPSTDSARVGGRSVESGHGGARSPAGSGGPASQSLDIRRLQSLFKTAAEENIQCIRTYVTELKERVAKLHYQKQLLVCQVLELESSQQALVEGMGTATTSEECGGVTGPTESADALCEVEDLEQEVDQPMSTQQQQEQQQQEQQQQKQEQYEQQQQQRLEPVQEPLVEQEEQQQQQKQDEEESAYEAAEGLGENDCCGSSDSHAGCAVADGGEGVGGGAAEGGGVGEGPCRLVPLQSPSWPEARFEREMASIVELWDLCQVSLLHRSEFYLLMKGSPSDLVYLHIELRRLRWLREQYFEDNERNPSAMRARDQELQKERDALAKRMRLRLTPAQREEMFAEWGIPVNSKKRKEQLAARLWSDPHDMHQVAASAKLVGQLAGFTGAAAADAVVTTVTGRTTPAEMLELRFAPPPWQKGWLTKRGAWVL